MVKVVGFAGPAGSGKTTAVKYLKEWLGFREMNFADPLKHGTSVMFNWPLSAMYDERKDLVDLRLGFSPRKALQLVGTECGRHLDEDIWVKIMDENINLLEPGSKVAIGDMRYENELSFIRSKGEDGLVIHLEGRKFLTLHTGLPAHSSEATLFKHHEDVTIWNGGNLEVFYQGLRTALYNRGFIDQPWMRG